MSDKNDKELAVDLGRFLNDEKAKGVVVLDVSETCSWADVFVVATYNSQGHLRGLIENLDAWAREHYSPDVRKAQKKQVNDWMLIDWDNIVIHLFSDSARSYYELEKLWFSAKTLYSS